MPRGYSHPHSSRNPIIFDPLALTRSPMDTPRPRCSVQLLARLVAVQVLRPAAEMERERKKILEKPQMMKDESNATDIGPLSSNVVRD